MNTVRLVSGLIITASASAWTAAQADAVTEWNAITVSCVQGSLNPANRAGPAGLLDIALVQAAVHDAVQAVQGRFEPYKYRNRRFRGVGSPEAAAAAASYGVLVGLYGADDPCLATVSDPADTYAGDPALKAGIAAAIALLPHARPTFALPTDPFTGSDAAGQWRPEPGVTGGFGTSLAHTLPFAMKWPSQFRPAPPPRLGSLRYAREYYEVKALGAATGSARTAEQDDIARFWTANYFSQWNQALRAIADEHLTDVGDSARLLALAAFAAADSQISVYDAKYRFNYWRPVTAIQHGDDDGNPLTVGDPSWTPLVPTPPYPEYSSGANCLVGAYSTILRLYFGTDRLRFSVWSTASGLVENPRIYDRFSHVASEVVEARILQGIHFRTAEVAGRLQGTQIAKWTFGNYLRPVAGRG